MIGRYSVSLANARRFCTQRWLFIEIDTQCIGPFEPARDTHFGSAQIAVRGDDQHGGFGPDLPQRGNGALGALGILDIDHGAKIRVFDDGAVCLWNGWIAGNGAGFGVRLVGRALANPAAHPPIRSAIAAPDVGAIANDE
jgi:hypothetical protein